MVWNTRSSRKSITLTRTSRIPEIQVSCTSIPWPPSTPCSSLMSGATLASLWLPPRLYERKVVHGHLKLLLAAASGWCGALSKTGLLRRCQPRSPILILGISVAWLSPPCVRRFFSGRNIAVTETKCANPRTTSPSEYVVTVCKCRKFHCMCCRSVPKGNIQ